MTPLTDDQLRQVAAQFILDDARRGDEPYGEDDQLTDALTACGLNPALIDPDEAYDATMDAVQALIATATITVEWPDSPVSVVGNPAPEEDA